jgi:predicted nucleotidyltransferase
MNQNDLPPLVQRSLQRFIRAFAPEKILLFGSYAKGTNQAYSDVDMLIVADLPGNPESHQRRARQLAADCFPRIDVAFATPQEVLQPEKVRSPFLQSILGTGVEIYRRDPGRC